MKKNRFLSLLLVLMLILGLFAGCGSSSAPNEEMDSEMHSGNAPAEDVPEKGLNSDNALTPVPESGRKLVKTVSMEAETETYDTLMADLDQQIVALGGYVEHRDSHNGSPRYGGESRSCTMTIRIPADRLDEFITKVSDSANVLDLSEATEDITLQYVDTESRIAALKTEQTRLMELLASAEDLEAVLLIEERLSDVNYELERYTSQMRTYDNQVDYATVTLSVWEVEVLTPVEEPSVWTRISTGLRDSFRNLGEDVVDTFVWFIVELPYLVIWAAVLGGGFFLLRKIFRRKKKTPVIPPQNDSKT